MITDLQTTISNCRAVATNHLGLANFMRQIGDYRAMDEHMDNAMQWAVHVDLLLHTQLNTGANHA